MKASVALIDTAVGSERRCGFCSPLSSALWLAARSRCERPASVLIVSRPGRTRGRPPHPVTWPRYRQSTCTSPPPDRRREPPSHVATAPQAPRLRGRSRLADRRLHEGERHVDLRHGAAVAALVRMMLVGQCPVLLAEREHRRQALRRRERGCHLGRLAAPSASPPPLRGRSAPYAAGPPPPPCWPPPGRLRRPRQSPSRPPLPSWPWGSFGRPEGHRLRRCRWRVRSTCA